MPQQSKTEPQPIGGSVDLVDLDVGVDRCHDVDEGPREPGDLSESECVHQKLSVFNAIDKLN